MRKKGQSMLEYAVFIAAFIAALIGMQLYLRYALQGKLKETADELSTQHYSPGHTESLITQTSDTLSVMDSQSDIVSNPVVGLRLKTVTNTTIVNETARRTGWERINE